MGIPPSVFRGRAVHDGKPLWSPSDRAEILALTEERRSVHSCGQPISESFSPANQLKYQAHAYVCHACKTAHMKAGDIEDMNGVTITVEKRTAL